jgi:hypothetical protein
VQENTWKNAIPDLQHWVLSHLTIQITPNVIQWH